MLAAIGVALNDLWELRTGRRQQVHVDVRRAAASLRGHSFQMLDGAGDAPPEFPELAYSDRYQCRDGRWIQLHGGFPHLGAGHQQGDRLGAQPRVDRGGRRPLGLPARSRRPWPRSACAG